MHRKVPPTPRNRQIGRMQSLRSFSPRVKENRGMDVDAPGERVEYDPERSIV